MSKNQADQSFRPKIFGILVLWLLVGYWWDEVQNRWDPSHFMPSQTPTNHPSQFFWHCHNSVPKWKVSNKIIFERIIESKSFILNRNLAFICQLFGNWQGESVKKRIFYGQADRKGGVGEWGRGGSATSALTVSKCENFDFFHWYWILWHSKHIFSHCKGSQNAILRPLIMR